MAKMIRRTIKINITGKTESDFDLALETALEKIKDGNVMGMDKNDDGSYYFEVN